jgi:hypothetical protein
VTESGEASVVPIALTLSGKTGYTIWAPPWIEDGDEWQAFLGAEGKVWLFEELADLEATLRSSLETDLSDHPAWPMLQTLPAAQLDPDADYRYDLDAVPELTEAAADAEVVEQVSDVIDMVERIAECCDNGTLLKLLEQPGFADLLGYDEDDEDEDEDGPESTAADADDEDDDLEDEDEDDEDDDAWDEIGTAIRTAWPGLTGKVEECVSWRTAADVPEPAELDEADEDEAGTAEEADEEADVEFWTEVGIMPIRLHLPSGVGYTLRCYVDDEPRFLGTDLTVDMFSSREGLVAFCQSEDEHDLAGLETWSQVREAADLDVSPPASERYDLTEVDAQLIGGPTVADVRLVRASVDALRDLADYCELVGVQAAFADDAPLGTTLTELYASSVGSSILPSYWSGEGAAAQWRTVLDEVDTCVRWHD